MKVRRLYEDVEQNCLMRHEGDYQKALFFQDCSWFEYYWRIAQHNEYKKRYKHEWEKSQAAAKAKQRK